MSSYQLYSSSNSSSSPYIDNSLSPFFRVYLGSASLSSFFLSVAIPLFLILLTLRRHQPLRSRGLVPWVGLLSIQIKCLIEGLILNIIYLANSGTPRDRALNIFQSIILLVVNPIVLLGLFQFLWEQLAFYCYLTIYENMCNNNAKNPVSIIYHLITSVYIHHMVNLIVVCVPFIVYGILFIIQENISRISIDTTPLGNTCKVIHFTLCYIVGLLWFIAVLWNTVAWRRAVKRRRQMTKEYINNNDNNGNLYAGISKPVFKFSNFLLDCFVEQDPLVFRMEWIATAFSFLANFVYNAANLADVKYGLKDGHPLEIVEVVFSSLYILFGIIAFGGITCFITTRHVYRSVTRLTFEMSPEEASPEQLELITKTMNDEQGYSLLKEYSIREFSLENVLLWKDLMEFSSHYDSLSLEARTEQALKISQQYFEKWSPCKVKLSSKLKVKFSNLCISLQQMTEEEAREVLNELYTAIIINISDTWSRFYWTETYRTYAGLRKQTSEERLKMIEQAVFSKQMHHENMEHIQEEDITAHHRYGINRKASIQQAVDISLQEPIDLGLDSNLHL